MVYLKTNDEIALLKRSNQLVGLTLAEVAKHIKPGVNLSPVQSVPRSMMSWCTASRRTRFSRMVT